MSYERTPEHRQRQAERIRQWRPWEKSTGPRSADGKAASALNALKHGARSAEALAAQRRIGDWLRQARDACARMKANGKERKRASR